MIVRSASAVAGALVLAACAVAQPAPVPGGNPGGTCDGSNLKQFVGRQATSDLAAEMLGVSGAAVLRWVPHGTMITMEFRPDRLTVFLDSANRVERPSCS